MSDSDPLKAFVAANLQACAADILAWRRHGVLSDGAVRKAEALVPAALQDDPLMHVEFVSVEQCLRFVANTPREPGP